MTNSAPDRKRSEAVIISDLTGKLLATTEGTSEWLVVQPGQPSCAPSCAEDSDHATRYDDLLGHNSDLTRWIAEQMEQGRDQNSHRASAVVSHNGQLVHVELNALNDSGELYGYILHLANESLDGGSLVTQQQWHDIKNHLGGIKLYATFLQKKLPDGEDREVVNKMLRAINTLTDQLTQIRRGDPT